MDLRRLERLVDEAKDAATGHTHTAADVGAVPVTRKVNGKALSGDITLSAADVKARASDWTPSAADVGAVPVTRKVNGKTLSGDITLSAADVKARPSDWTPSAADAGAVPVTRKVNGKALSADITLSASDVNARPSSWMPNANDVGAVASSLRGKANGVASLDASGKVPKLQLPETGGKRVVRLTVGTSTAGWTLDDTDYLCDGVDDQAEIIAAIQALPAEGGEIVILDGTYRITGTIELNRGNTVLTGNGPVTVLKRMWEDTGKVTSVIRITTSGNIVRNLGFDGNKAAYPSAMNTGIRFDGTESSPAENNRILNNRVCDFGNGGIQIAYYCSNNVYQGNICNGNLTGISVYANSKYNQYLNNVCCDNVTGIQDISSDQNVFIGNICNGNQNNGISIKTCKGNVISGNNCENNGSAGIYVHTARYSNVSDNVCINNGSGTSWEGPIFLTTGSDHNVISGNVCLRNDPVTGDNGIHLHESSHNAVSGNRVEGYDRGIAIYTANSNEISGNDFSGNKTGIYFFGSSTRNNISCNVCNDCTEIGIHFSGSGNNQNTVIGNTCIRGSGASGDYTSSQYTLRVTGSANNYNLIACNNFMGKNYVSDGGSGNTFVNNKYN